MASVAAILKSSGLGVILGGAGVGGSVFGSLCWVLDTTLVNCNSKSAFNLTNYLIETSKVSITPGKGTSFSSSRATPSNSVARSARI